MGGYTKLAVLFLAAVVVGVVAQTPKCGACDRSSCPPVEECPGAEAMDACNCCVMCQRALGQRCDGGEALEYGPCGDYLACRPRKDLTHQAGSPEYSCQCQKAGVVCGTDGATYTTLCHLVAEGSSNLTIQHDGPCPSAPVIRTGPMSSRRQPGSILILDCEALGVPVPEIFWELLKPNGESELLPNDDSSVAVQSRGGPEPFMVTGWVQVMRVTREAQGTYICNARNSRGTARATASITLANTQPRTHRRRNGL